MASRRTHKQEIQLTAENEIYDQEQAKQAEVAVVEISSSEEDGYAYLVSDPATFSNQDLPSAVETQALYLLQGREINANVECCFTRKGDVRLNIKKDPSDQSGHFLPEHLAIIRELICESACPENCRASIINANLYCISVQIAKKN